jgi:hypothetical protein
MRRRLPLLLALALTGCSLAPSDKVMEALAGNERSWCVSITSVYGTVRMGGTGIQGGSMLCTQEGMNVKDDASRMSIPITVSPTVTVSPTAPVTKPNP